MNNISERAAILSSAFELPAFILENDNLIAISRGTLSPELFSAYYYYLNNSKAKIPQLKPPFHVQLLKHVDTNGLISLAFIDIKKEGITAISFGPFREKNDDTSSLINTLTLLPGFNYTREKAIDQIKTIPEKDERFIASWAKVTLSFLLDNRIRERGIHTIKRDDNFFTPSFKNSNESIEESNAIASAALEKEIREYITIGDKEKLKELLLDGDFLKYLTRRDNSFQKLRSAKNSLLEINSIFRIYTEASGVSPIITRSVSEKMLKEIESAYDLDSLKKILRNMIDEYTLPISTSSSRSRSGKIRKAQRYIINNLGNKITLDKLSKEVGLNKEYLCRLFKKENKMTINDYITMLRISEAKHLLESTTLPIIDIALSVDFKDQSHFTKIFGKVTGLTPSKYRDSLLS